jgi:callose synthase
MTRFLKIPFTVCLILTCVVFFRKNPFFIHMAAGLYYLMAGLYTVGVVVGIPFVSQLLRVHDYLCGHAMFIPLLVLAALQIPDKIQTWLLYHNALSEGVLIDTILKQARQTQKTDMEGHATGLAMTEPSSQAIAELRSKVDEQQQMLGRLLVSSQPESERGKPISGQGGFIGRGPIG